MKAKRFAGLLLALVLSACPILATFSSAAGPRGEHSCCPADESGKNRLPSAPASGDCCLRAPAHAAAFVVTPEFHVVFIAATREPAMPRAQRLLTLDSSDSSPPDDDHSVRGFSPRSPPVPA